MHKNQQYVTLGHHAGAYNFSLTSFPVYVKNTNALYN